MQLSPLEKAANALEWNRFLSRCEPEARTEPGKALLLALTDPSRWANDLATARLLQQETQEVTPLLDKDSLWGPLTGLPDVAPSIERLGRGSVLEVVELANLRTWLYAIDSWATLPKEEIRGERLKRDVLKLLDPHQALRVLDQLLTPEGELSERASPRLAQLYSEIRSLKREIGIVLDQVVKQLGTRGVLQESFSDIRDGRYVVPVKISNQGDVEGTIYEASASRQTVFIEPKEVAPLNNRLRQRQNELIQEIYIVLEAACKKLSPMTSEVDLSVSVLAHWDSVQARARFGRHFSGKPILVQEDQGFLLRQTAHPLLWWSLKPEQIVRNDIDFDHPARTLLLTGPNTGGKTVLLKTLGLAAICARTGFPFPATDHPAVPFFDSLFADLGDPQSIEEHLSSFSGHILRYKEILETLGTRSLVLLDELNSATDPEEGAALGRSFLETIMSEGAFVVATTHDPNLKAMAVSDKRIQSASMAFDESSRHPTYRVVIGVPGRSRALETAERLGLPRAVLELARSYLSSGHAEFERLLAKLETDAAESNRARKEAERLREEAERLKTEWTKKTELAVSEMLDRARARLKRVIEQAQDEVRASVQKLDELRNRRELDQTRAKLNESLATATDRVEQALGEEAPQLAEAVAKRAEERKQEIAERPPLQAGDSVRVPKWKAIGIVIEVKDGKAKVALGNLQVSLATDEIEVATATEAAQGKRATLGSPKPKATTTVPDVPVPPEQLDLRGMRLDDAMGELGRYLDQAYRSGGRAQVTIIHGLGTGALREGARKLIGELPYVKEFRDGGVGHGGAGATLVEFERD
jgi:DNA mismatch repair protein MutS2